MKLIQRIAIALLLISSYSQSIAQTNDLKHFQVGMGIGEIPTRNNLISSFTLGYHINDKMYIGGMYQTLYTPNNASSANANSLNLSGFESSIYNPTYRGLLQFRYKPIKFSPYFSVGVAINGTSTELLQYNDQSRIIAGETYQGTILIKQTLPVRLGISLVGIGYQYDFKSGLSLGLEWNPVWGQQSNARYDFVGTTDLSQQAKDELTQLMDKDLDVNKAFRYKVFHIGIAYRF